MQRKTQYIFYCSNSACDFMCKKLTELSAHHPNCQAAGSSAPTPSLASQENAPAPKAQSSSMNSAQKGSLTAPKSSANEKPSAPHPPKVVSTPKPKEKLRQDAPSQEEANSMYQCSYCSFITTTLANILKHGANEHGQTEGSFTVITASNDGNMQVLPESQKESPRAQKKPAVEPEQLAPNMVPKAPETKEQKQSETKKSEDSDSSSSDSDDSSEDDDDDESSDSDDSDDDDDDSSDDSEDSSDDSKSEKSKDGPPPLTPQK
jgi:hypothetical protein